MRIKLLIILILLCTRLFAQNLVNNPGFETNRGNPNTINELRLAIGWSNCNSSYGATNAYGTPDYLSALGSGLVQLPYCQDGYINPYAGNCIMALVTYDGEATNYREYASTFLTSSLVVGRTYTVSFYTSIGFGDQTVEYISNNIGILFSVDSITQPNQEDIVPRTPQINMTNVVSPNGWEKYSFTFKADSAYKYITVGNYYDDASTTLVDTFTNAFNPYAYYFFDDFSVIPKNISSDTTICQGNSVTLFANDFSSYAWSTTSSSTVFSTDSVIVVTPIVSTNYIMSGNGITDTVKVTVVPALPLIILPQPPPTICATIQSVTLRIKNKGSDFTWSPSEGLSATTGDSVIANPSVSVTYSVHGIDSLGCFATGTEPVNILPITNTPAFIQHNDTLISSAKTDNQWYRNDTLLLNDTSQYLIITVLGHYYVEVNNEANGCSTSSDTIGITSLTGIEQLTVDRQKLIVYPNPSTGLITVSFSNYINDLKITDLLGQLIYETHPEKNQLNFILNNEGVYFVTVTSDNEIITEKIIVIR